MLNALDDRFYKTVAASTQRTLKEMARSEPDLLMMGHRAALPSFYATLGAHMGITGPRVQGAMVFSFPDSTILGLVNKILGTEYLDVTPEIESSVTEFAQIIFSQMRVSLSEAGYEFRMALPTLIRGRGLTPVFPLAESSHGVFLRYPYGPMCIEFAQRSMSETREAESGVGEPPPFDAKVLVPFVNGVRQTLELQFRIHATPGKPYAKGTQVDFASDLVVMIGVAGRSFRGTISICFPHPVLFGLMSKMMNEPVSSVTSDVEDSAAEMGNIMVSVAKQFLNQQGFGVQSTIPVVLQGKALHTSYPARESTIVLPFSVEWGTFWVEFGLKGYGSDSTNFSM